MQERPKSNLLAVSVVVTTVAGKVLLRQRDKDPDLGKWELFATYPYLDEPLAEAVTRVLSEKAGVSDVSHMEFSGKYYDRPNRHPGKSCIPLIFTATVSESTRRAESTRWFTRTELVDLPMALDNKQTLIDLELVG